MADNVHHEVIEIDATVSSSLAKATNQVTNQLKRLNKTMQPFNEDMASSLSSLQIMVPQLDKVSQGANKVAGAQKTATKASKGFRMELLGVMFFGQMVQKTLMGLLQPAMEVAGVFDLIRIILQVLFLPIILALLPWLLLMMQWFLDLDPATQKLIGTIVILGIVIGALLFLFGMLGLAMDSLALAFGAEKLASAGKFFIVLVALVFIAYGALLLFEGYMKGDWFTGVKGALLVIGGIFAIVFGGWIGVLILAVTALIVYLMGRFPKFGAVVMTVFGIAVIPLIYFYSILKSIWDLLHGKWVSPSSIFMEIEKGYWTATKAKWDGLPQEVKKSMDLTTNSINNGLITQEMTVDTSLNNMGISYNEFLNGSMVPVTEAYSEMGNKVTKLMNDTKLYDQTVKVTTPSLKNMDLTTIGLKDNTDIYNQILPQITDNLNTLGITGTEFTSVMTNQENPAIVDQTNKATALSASLENLIRLKKRLTAGASAALQEIGTQGWSMAQGESGLKKGEKMYITDPITKQKTEITGTGDGNFRTSELGADPSGFIDTMNAEEYLALFGQPGSVSDFMWRPGSNPVSFSPNDTIVGYKNDGAGAGGMGGGVTIANTYNITVSDRNELIRLMEAKDKEMINELKRNR